MSKQKQQFIHELAIFLVGDQAEKSIELEMGKKSAKQWAKLRNATPLFGKLTRDEAEEQLRDFLG